MARSRRPAFDIFNLSLDAMRLGMEAQSVIALRMMKVAAGGAAADVEMRRMIAEKVGAAAELQTKAAIALMSGGSLSPQATISHYRRKVRANRRRLSKPG